MNQNRILIEREHLKDQEIYDFVMREDTNDLNNFLVFNGGTGLGKTRQAVTTFKKAITEKEKKNPRILLVESRTITVQQTEINYPNEIFNTFGGILPVQRITFMNMIKNGKVDYDWIIIDECHGLFSEASFAEDAGYIANWIRCGRENQRIAFVTANDEYFIDIFQKYFPNEYRCAQLFENLQVYYSSTYIKQAVGIITSATTARIKSLLHNLKGKKGIIFFQNASSVKNWYFDLIKTDFKPFLIVSLANQTSTNLSTAQTKLLQDRDIDFSGGESGLTMADLEAALDAQRIKEGKKSVRNSIINGGIIPDDIDILLATDTLQEGMDIKSHIDYIIIEGYTEVEVRQKIGRYREPLDTLYLIINTTTVSRGLKEEKKYFEMFYQLEAAGEQTKLAELYGQFAGRKWQRRYIIKTKRNGKDYYKVNEEYYNDFLRRCEKFNALSSQEYITNLLTPHVRNAKTDILLLERKDFFTLDAKENIEALARKWSGIPLKGKAQEDFMADVQDYGLLDSKGKPVTGFKKAISLVEEIGIKVDYRQANKNDLKKYPDFLKSAREKFKIIIF